MTSSAQQPRMMDLIRSAAALHHAGRLDDAAEIYQQCLKAEPHNVDALHLLGLVVHKKGLYEQAIKLIKHAIRLKPDFWGAYANLAKIYFEIHNYNEAAILLERAIKKNPGDYELLYNLGFALERIGNFAEALSLGENLIAQEIDTPDLYTLMANACMGLRRVEEAEEYFLDVIKRYPAYTTARIGLIQFYMAENRNKEAITQCKHALKIDTENVPVNALYARLISPGPEDAQTRKLEELLTGDLLPLQKSSVHFILVDIYEKAADYKKAFGHLYEANRLRREAFFYNPDIPEREMKGFIKKYTKSFMAKRQGWGVADKTPVFIVGMPRSGTTLTEQILASHPQVFGAGELTSIYQLIISVEHDLAGGHPACADKLTRKKVKQLGQQYIEMARAVTGESNPTFITDKMPLNAINIGFIKLVLPHARIIHCKRDPVDTCLSCYKTLFQKQNFYTYDMEELGHFYKNYEKIMAHWHKVFPGEILDVHYEDTVADQEIQTRRLLEFLGLPWDDACLSFYKTKRPVFTASMQQVRQPIYKTSVKKWKHYAPYLTPLLEALDIKG